MLVFAALFVPAQTATGSSSVLCTGYASCASRGYSSSGYDSHKSTSYWRMYTGTNCTNYVAYRLVSTNGMPNVRPKAGVGNARDWGTAMSSVTNSTPTVGSVAWWGRTGNHVAYIEKVVSASEIWVSESNWSGAFDWRKITKSGSGWPDGFIHFADRASSKLTNTSKPTLGSTPTVGVPLTPSVGKWTVMGNSYQFQWQADGVAISGATAKSFTPTPAVVGQDLVLQVTASRPSYSAGTASSAAAEVQPGTLAPGKPAVKGAGRVGEPLTVSPGSWTPAPARYDYQWLVDGTPVANATSSTFTPRRGDVGRAVTVRVEGALAGYRTTGTTAPAVTVSPGAVTPTANPAVSGTPRVGSPLTASPGSWSATGLSYDFQWLVGGVEVEGATDSTYSPVAADRAKPVSVRVTAGGAGYGDSTATSAATAPVGYGTLPSFTPKIIGAARLGSITTADPDPSSVAGATATYQWLRDGIVKPGATTAARTVIASDLGKKLSIRVTWTAPGYTARTAVSSQTSAAKASAALTVTAAPSTGKVRFAVALPVTGMTAPSATIVVSRHGGGQVSFKITNGAGSYTLARQPRGTNSYTFTYAGTSTITSATTTLTTKIG
jgi:surface antigen